jgi:CRP-like cAMP-binding protein
MNSFRKHLESIAEVSERDWQIFSSYLKERIFLKNSVFLAQGEVENHISFIENGQVRLFIPNEEEKNETTIGFRFAKDLLSAYDSFLTRTPSRYQLEAMADTKLLSISFNDLQKVYQKTDIGNTIGRFISEKMYIKRFNREQSLLNETAEQRYLNLFKERPRIIKQIPLKHIASYIGVTPQALSRIRKRIS